MIHMAHGCAVPDRTFDKQNHLLALMLDLALGRRPVSYRVADEGDTSITMHIRAASGLRWSCQQQIAMTGSILPDSTIRVSAPFRVISRWILEPDSGRSRRTGLVGRRKCPGVALRRGVAMSVSDWGGRASEHRRAGAGRAVADGTSRGGVFASHHEVQVRLGQVAEAGVKDDGERDVVQCGVVGGSVAGADAAGILSPRVASRR